MSNGLIRLSTKRNIYSAIFKTVQDLTTGKTKITSSGLFNGIFKGDFFKAQPIVSESDIAALENYNKLLANNKPQEAFEQAMNKASVTAQNLAKSANGVAVDIANIPKATKAATVGMKALSVAGNMLLSIGISLAIQGLITLLDNLIHASEKAAEEAGEAFDKVKSEMQELDSLIEEYNELQLSGEWDNTPIKTKKQLHEDINRLLGEEAGKIDIINGKYKEITEELFKQRMVKLSEEERAAYDNMQAQSSNLWNTVYWNGHESGGFNYGTSRATEDEKKFIEKYKNILEEKSFYIARGVSSSDYVIRFNDFGDFMVKYEETKKMLDELYYAGMGESDLYKELNSFIQQFDTNVNNYETGVKEYENIKVKQKIAEYIADNAGGYIDNLEEYSTVIKWVNGNFSGEDKDNALGFLNLYFSEYTEKIDTTTGNVNELTVSIEDLKSASDGLKILGTAFKEMSDDGHISLATLEDIKTTFAGSVDDIDSYIDRLMKAEAGSEEFTSALTDLTYGYINQKMSTEQLAKADEAYIATLLKEVGVSNSVRVAQHMIAVAKEKVRLETEGFTSKTEDEIVSLLNEEGQSDATRQALVELARKKVELGATKIDTSEDVQELLNIAKAAGIGVEALETLEKIKPYLDNFEGPIPRDIAQLISDFKSGNFDWGWDTLERPTTRYTDSNKSKKDIEKERLEKARDYAEKVADIQEDLAEKEADFAENMADAWKEEHLEQLKDGLEKQKDLIDRYKKNVEVLDFGLEHVETDDFANRADLLSDKLDKLHSYGAAMRAEFDRVANTIPQTGDEAVELANRLEELGSDMRNNASNIRETTIELQKLAIEMSAMVVDTHFGELQKEIDDIDRRINILKSDYSEDFSHVTDIMNLDALLPVYSDFDKERREKQRADKALIKTEQETQDKINEIVSKALEQQSKDNAEARAKERAKLIEDMEKARKEAQKKLDEAHQDYLDFLEDNKLATSGGVKKIIDLFANADIKLAEIDISSIDRAIALAKKKIDEFITNRTSGGSIIDAAAKYDGTPYVWGGGHSNDFTTMDCSGYVSKVLMDLGYIDSPRIADGFKSVGTKIDPSDMQPGDLLIFDYEKEGKRDGIADHIAFYAGDGKMWHSSGQGEENTASNPGKGVYLADFSDHYKKNLLQVNRVYASGTPLGNAKAGRLGLAGENYKPEILIDKATGKTTYIDSPTVIDPSKTDVIGEEATARMPKFADGTVADSIGVETDDELIKWIESFYTKATDEIGNIQRDYITKTAAIENDNLSGSFDKTQQLYDLLYDNGIAATEAASTIYDNLFSDFGEWIAEVKADPEKWSSEVYNAYINTLQDIKDMAYEIADKSTGYKKAAAEDAWQNSTNYIDERNKKGDWDLFGDSEVDAWGRVVEWLKEEYPNELGKIKEAEEKLFESSKKEMEKSISDIDDYINARNHYNDWDAYGDSELEAVQRQTEIIKDAYKQRLLSTEEYVDRLEDTSQRIYTLGQNEVDKHLSNIDSYISARNLYNDWDVFGDSEIEAVKRQLQILDEARKLDLISLEEYTEKYAEYTQKLYSIAKNDIIKTISKLIEDYEEIKQDEIDALSFESSQYDSLKTLLQSYYDVTNAVTEAQHEINKELKASQSMYEYLNEETRELLFNQEDYNTLSEELLDIQAAANELQKQYEEDILGASEETIAEITSQYQIQYETMMKQYEIAKAELEVAKKRQKLDNVLAERNVRMFINGQWQWVANTQDVIDAENELADAENEKKKVETSLDQTNSINELTEAQNAIATQINYLETDLEEVRNYWSDMQELLNGESDEVASALRQISKVSSPELKRVIETTGGDVKGFSSIIFESTTTLSDIINGDTGLKGASTSIGDIVTDLQNYSKALQTLTDEINGVDPNRNNGGNGSSSVKDVIAEMKANSDKWYTASEKEREELHQLNQQLGDSIGADYDEATGKWYSSDGKLLYESSSSKGSSSSGGGSSSSTKNKNNATATIPGVGTVGVKINSNGKTTTTGLPVGTIVHTAGGDYRITGGTGGNYTSVKIDEKHADGTRYTPGGLTALGEEGFEAFISGNGRLIPITQPTIGNIGAGGIVFNREQMANLRNLWDLSNIGKISPFVSSSNMSKQNTTIDNSIHINGLTVGEQGNEDWINGLRRYVATHK